MRWFPYWAFLPMRRYAQFSGRARRQEFWSFTIASTVASIGFDIVDENAGLTFDHAQWALGSSGILGSIFSLAILLPSCELSGGCSSGVTGQD